MLEFATVGLLERQIPVVCSGSGNDASSTQLFDANISVSGMLTFSYSSSTTEYLSFSWNKNNFFQFTCEALLRECKECLRCENTKFEPKIIWTENYSNRSIHSHTRESSAWLPIAKGFSHFPSRITYSSLPDIPGMRHSPAKPKLFILL